MPIDLKVFSYRLRRKELRSSQRIAQGDAVPLCPGHDRCQQCAKSILSPAASLISISRLGSRASACSAMSRNLSPKLEKQSLCAVTDIAAGEELDQLQQFGVRERALSFLPSRTEAAGKVSR
jgi:hypothetical protein